MHGNVAPKKLTSDDLWSGRTWIQAFNFSGEEEEEEEEEEEKEGIKVDSKMEPSKYAKFMMELRGGKGGGE